jgi:transcriptional regulator with XRE-family HTH domain
LRKARKARGYGLRELARAIGVHPADLSNWELGSRVPKLEEVALLLGQLRVGVDERNRLLGLAAHAREPNWLESTVAPDVTTHAEFERAADAVITWQPTLMPGLLQTEDYIRALVGIPQRTRDEIEHLTAVKLARQERLRGRHPLDYTVLLGEIALRCGFGGPAVMAEQLHRLLAAMNRENIDLRILPATDHGHPGVSKSPPDRGTPSWKSAHVHRVRALALQVVALRVLGETELPVQPVRVDGVEHPAEAGARPVVDHLPDDLLAETAAARGVDDEHVGEVCGRNTVREGPRKPDHRAAAVGTDHAP